MWWIILPLVALFVAAKAKAATQVSAQTAQPQSNLAPNPTPTPANLTAAPVPPQNASTVTDAPQNLASAFLVYSTILRNKLASATGGGGSMASPGAPFFGGGGGSGGGHGSIGCPVKGTEISCLGVPTCDLSEFEADNFVTVKAGEFELTATPSHRLFTAERGIVFLGDLRQGDNVITQGGERSVTSIFKFSERKTALRIHVPESHLYFAGGILSHNKA
jgi:hypothetical protein